MSVLVLITASLAAAQTPEATGLRTVWEDFRYDEIHYSGGKVCERYKRLRLSTRFQRRFGARIVRLRAAADAQLGKAVTEGEFIVTADCVELERTDRRYLDKTYLDPFDARLALAERAFEIGTDVKQ